MALIFAEGWGHWTASDIPIRWEKKGVDYPTITEKTLIVETPHGYYIGPGPLTIIVGEDRTLIIQEYLPNG